MTRTDHILTSPQSRAITGAALSAVWLLFAIAHLSTFGQSGRTSLLMFAIAETVIAVFFLLRTQPKTFTNNPFEWAIAVAGTCLPLLLRPTSDSPLPIAEWGLMIGSTMQLAGVLSLNRSFAIVPALRELKTAGMYRFVRHPIYFSYLITFSFYAAANLSPRNLMILLASFGLMLARIHLEERHLAQAPEYRAYRSRVRWRLIPFVF